MHTHVGTNFAGQKHSKSNPPESGSEKSAMQFISFFVIDSPVQDAVVTAARKTRAYRGRGDDGGTQTFPSQAPENFTSLACCCCCCSGIINGFRKSIQKLQCLLQKPLRSAHAHAPDRCVCVCEWCLRLPLSRLQFYRI